MHTYSADHLPRNRRWITGYCLWLVATLLLACTPTRLDPLPTSLPEAYLSTAIVLTIQANAAPAGLTPTLEQGVSSSGTAAEDAAPTRPSATPNAASLGITPKPTSLPTGVAPEDTLTPTLRPTPTPSPTPTLAILEEAIQILSPGPQSRLVSPLHLNTYFKPGLDGRVQIELVGEDSRLLLRKVYTYNLDVGRIYLTEDFPFEIRQVGETARLQISTFDTFNRLLAFNSVDLVLLSFGENDINPAGNLSERILIAEPASNKLIQGGNLVVSGQARPSSDLPLLVELTTSTGKVVGYRQASVTPSADGSYVPFSVEVPYAVTEPTWVRLSVREDSGGRIGGTIYLTSLEVLLSP